MVLVAEEEASLAEVGVCHVEVGAYPEEMRLSLAAVAVFPAAAVRYSGGGAIPLAEGAMDPAEA
jgi:hypothetical protein